MQRQENADEVDTDLDVWTAEEWQQIQCGHIAESDDEWLVPSDDGPWHVWRGWGDDSHERLYRSPTGQYYLGTVAYTGWGVTSWRDRELVPPFDDEKYWVGNPLQSAPPMSIRNAERKLAPDLHDYDAAYRFAAEQPRTFMQIVAAAWFVDRALGDHTRPCDCPDELKSFARELEDRIWEDKTKQ